MSEKPSDISPTLLPRDDLPTLLLDENLSSFDIADWLRRFKTEWHVERHLDHLPRGADDVYVIEQCAIRGWILVSCDDRIRYVPKNKAAALKHKLKSFMFAKGNYQGIEYAAAMVVSRGQIINMIRKTAGPFFTRIQRSGEVVLLEPQQPKEKNVQRSRTSRERTALKYGKDAIENT
jgi:hypothetical protein